MARTRQTPRGVCWTEGLSLDDLGESHQKHAPVGKVISLSFRHCPLAADAPAHRPRPGDTSAAGGLFWPWPLPLAANHMPPVRRGAGATQ